MFLTDDEWKAPEIPARKPARGFSSFTEGLGAAATAERFETNSWNLRGRRTASYLDDLRGQVEEALGPAAVKEALDTDRRMTTHQRERREKQVLVDLAKRAREQGAEIDAPGSPEEIEKAVQEQIRAEYQDAVDTLDYMKGGRFAAEFAGRGFTAITDPTSLALTAVSGGTGSFARILAREALMGAAGEAAILPRQYEMAEYLGIDDPNPVAQVALGALFAGGIYGGAKAATRGGRAQISAELARALDYARTRNRSGSMERTAEIDAAEDALVGGRPVPTSPPLRLGVEAGTRIDESPQRDFAPIDIDEDVPLDRMIEETDAAIREMRKSNRLATNTRPLTRLLRGIDPDGPVGQELRNAGITAKTAPGFYKRGGRQSLDNLPLNELDESLPGLGAILRDDGAGYADQDSLVEALVEELTGNRLDVGGYGELRALEENAERLRRLRDLSAQRFDVADDPEGWLKTRAAARDAINDYLTVSGADAEFPDYLRDEMADALAEQGGSLDDAFRAISQRDLDIAEGLADGDFAADDPFLEGGAPPPRQGDTLEPAGVAEAEAGGGPRGEAGGGIETGGALLERTAAGDQALMEGVAPITDRDRMEAAMRRPMRGGDAPPDDGRFSLFGDPAARADMFDDTSDVSRAATADLRAEIEEMGDFPVQMDLDGEGRTMSATEWLDRLDAEEEFVEVAELCGIQRGGAS